MIDAKALLSRQLLAAEHLEGFFVEVRRQLAAQGCESGLVDYVDARLRQAIDYNPMPPPLPAGVTQAQADQLREPLLAALLQVVGALGLAYIELWGYVRRE